MTQSVKANQNIIGVGLHIRVSPGKNICICRSQSKEDPVTISLIFGDLYRANWRTSFKCVCEHGIGPIGGAVVDQDDVYIVSFPNRFPQAGDNQRNIVSLVVTGNYNRELHRVQGSLAVNSVQ
ncbi:hypothetical protein AGR7B_Lc170008 [Agrobacterium deltaense RV3]|nr:hypothetical protein AGR7B_Lc170008 [Agrobacterium deltaense RV3]